jgi:glycosyltransferase involved in cell wall biosynthesis
LVVMVAMAGGMPVLATTRVGAAAAYVRERETGFRFDFGNNPQLHGALDYCISHKDEVRRMGIEARRSVESWTPRNVADQIRRIVLEDWARRRK